METFPIQMETNVDQIMLCGRQNRREEGCGRPIVLQRRLDGRWRPNPILQASLLLTEQMSPFLLAKEDKRHHHIGFTAMSSKLDF